MYTIAQQPENKYCNYFDYAVQLCGEGSSLRADCMYTPIGRIAESIVVSFKKEEVVYSLSDFKKISSEYERLWNAEDCMLKIKLMEGPSDLKLVEVRIILKRDGIRVKTDAENCGYTPIISGELIFGKKDSVQAVSFERIGMDLRSSYGPAASKIDDALFDRDTDRALRINSINCRIKFNFEKNRYCFTANNELHLFVEENVFETRFHVKYKAINKKNTFPTPPAGWMTWYAVKFDACEAAVLDSVVNK